MADLAELPPGGGSVSGGSDKSAPSIKNLFGPESLAGPMTLTIGESNRGDLARLVRLCLVGQPTVGGAGRADVGHVGEKGADPAYTQNSGTLHTTPVARHIEYLSSIPQQDVLPIVTS